MKEEGRKESAAPKAHEALQSIESRIQEHAAILNEIKRKLPETLLENPENE
jgi:hypothetical protein